MHQNRWLVPLIFCLGCDRATTERPREPPPIGKDTPSAPGKEEITPPLPAEKAPPASPRLQDVPGATTVLRATESHFAGNIGRRLYLQVDKPLYKPGETIWIKSWNLRARDFKSEDPTTVLYELVSPKGSVVIKKLVQQENGLASNDFTIPDGAQGGEYTLKATSGPLLAERPLVISNYEPPRIKKKLEFTRKAYGPGDEVAATIKINRPTGEPLGRHPLRGVVILDGENLTPIDASTNAEGGALLKFKLPAKIERGDGLLTVMIEDGGITESIGKRVPIVLKKLDFAFFPEGGQMIAGLPTRLYFEAKTTIGKPADVEGQIIDDHGQAVAKFSTYHFGLGRLEFTPSTGRTYQAEITKPEGIAEKYPLPLAQEKGCTLRSFDDFDGQESALRLAVRCTERKKVVVVGLLREMPIDSAAVDVPEGTAAIVVLAAKDAALAKAQGAARVTLFDEALRPLAERLVYRNRRSGLKVEILPDAEAYTPREQVALTVRTTDGAGTPISAEVALSVVDDTVVSFADEKTGHMLSQLFLETEIPGKIEEPKFFFDLKEEKSAIAMDLLLGSRGWRKFEWQAVLSAPPMVATRGGGADPDMQLGDKLANLKKGEEPLDNEEGARRPRDPAKPKAMRPVPAVAAPEAAKEAEMPAPAKKALEPPARQQAALAAVPPAPPAAPPPPAEVQVAEPMAKMEAKAAKVDAADELDGLQGFGMGRGEEGAGMGSRVDAQGDDDFHGKDMDRRLRAAGGKRLAQPPLSISPIRVFPAPTYSADYKGPRTDFRETIHWAPSVRTGNHGKAIVTFYLSDAVTSFRVFAEGAGSGLAGREEKVIKSSLPFSMSVKLPLEVSANDQILIPLTLSNEGGKALPIELSASFGELLNVERQANIEGGNIAANARQSLFYALRVVGTQGESKVRFSANAGGLIDEFERTVTVVPAGFPIQEAAGGTLEKEASASFNLGEAIEGSVMASIKLEASPVGTMLSGLAGMLQEPGGCFEQTSSTNYPNVMVMQYLRSNDVADPDLLERSNGLLDRGYQRLVGFETQKKGYEWFGRAPAHEALTAYGLLEFADMKRVYGGVDDSMLERTAAWLRSRRDGKGGFLRDAQALDTFGQAAPEITNAYIIYSVVEAGLGANFEAEIATQATLAESTTDPYLLALTANTLLGTPSRHSEGEAAVKKLVAMQQSEGSWAGANHSVTRSTGHNLNIETTALAILATLKMNGQDVAAANGVRWLYKARGGYGGFGATQATVLALKALTAYSQKFKQTQSPGMVRVMINGKEAGQTSYEAGRREPIELKDLGTFFTSGMNKIDLVNTGGSALPYAIAVEFRSKKPANHPSAAVEVETKLAKTELKMGENVRVVAVVKNRTDAGQPMALARIGLPGGLSFQNWQLKELTEKGLIAFYETRAREIILYFRDLAPSASHEIPLDLVATVPGEYEGPASSAYLYYTNDQKMWADGLRVKIKP